MISEKTMTLLPFSVLRCVGRRGRRMMIAIIVFFRCYLLGMVMVYILYTMNN